MEINFNVHGQQRKKLVEQIANYTQQKAEYQYTPTYAYQIGKYTVSKDGNLSSPDEIPSNLIDKLKELGFRPANIIKLHLAYRRDDFTDQALENLRHLIWAKGQLIKDACQLDSLKLVQYAKNHQRIVSEPHEESNEKYAFRCFLLRLGFIGPEYKTQRKVLLRNLAGSAAFKNQEA